MSVVIINDELNALSRDIWEWTKDGRPISQAPDDIKEKAARYKELYLKLKKQELQYMGIDL